MKTFAFNLFLGGVVLTAASIAEFGVAAHAATAQVLSGLAGLFFALAFAAALTPRQ
jgi:hypothetical protein